MTEYRNIDAILQDRPWIAVADDESPEFSVIPEICDEVLLDTVHCYPIMVEVSWMSADRETLRGTVTRVDSSRGESEGIDEGDIVEFSRKKIGAIYKSDDRGTR